jgi:hypothetical protein
VTDDRGDASSTRKSPTRRAPPDGRRVAAWIATAIGIVAGGYEIAAHIDPIVAAQYGLAFASGLMWCDQVGQSPPAAPGLSDADVPPLRGLELFGFAWVALAVLGFATSPSLLLVAVATAIFSLYTLAQWECALRHVPKRGTLARRLLSALFQYKRRVGRRVSGRLVAAPLIALIATVGGSTALGIATTETKQSPPAPAPATTKQPAKSGPAPSNPPASGETTTAPAPTKPAPPSGFNCRFHEYPEAEWASVPIRELLESGAGLGPKEEGCVESLHTEYETTHHFVWGQGLKPITGQVLSVVMDSYALSPSAIYLAPATENVEALIHQYKIVGGTNRPRPYYRAGSGDFYLVNTVNNGTAVLIRTHSGHAFEAPKFLTLQPSVAVAWARIMQVKHSWQWVVEQSARNSAGEMVFKLTASGAEQPDATVTYSPRTGIAYWLVAPKSYEYPAHQAKIDPGELEQDIREYLPSSPEPSPHE